MDRLEARYLATMLGGAAAVALLGGASAYSGHHGADVMDLLSRTLILMIGIGVPGAWLMFLPIRRFLASPGTLPPPARRIRRLPSRLALWMGLLAAVTIGGHLGATHGSWSAVAGDGGAALATMAAHVALFAAYLGMCAFFVLKEYVAGLREALWRRHRVVIGPGGERLAVRLAIGFAAVAAGPALLFFSGAPLPADAGEHHALLRQALELDLLAAALFTVVLIVLVARTVARPVRNLMETMERVDRGEFNARAGVLSDDELGVLTARFNAMLDGLAERRRLQGAFSRFVPEGVVDALLSNEGALAAQEREASVLYTDIERFTDITAALPPREVLEMLNAYFEDVAEAIQRHGGVITQFQGDAVLAVFNFPVPQADYAKRALAAAREVARLEEIPVAGGPALRTRIGVATGRVVAGTVGGGDRLGYTVHGATVNLAARLEELNKQLGSQVLCDARTAALAGGAGLVDRGAVNVRGFATAVHVFEVVNDQASTARVKRSLPA